MLKSMFSLFIFAKRWVRKYSFVLHLYRLIILNLARGKKIVIDVIGPIYPPSATAHRFNLTLLDLCTRYVEAIPLRYISADMSLKL